MSHIATQSKIEEMSGSDDKTERLKAAFIQASRGNQVGGAHVWCYVQYIPDIMITGFVS